MADFDNSLSLSTLLCQEDEASCFNFAADFNPYDSYLESNFVLDTEEIEYIEDMVERETRSFQYCSIDMFNWLKCARFDAIEWILNVGSLFSPVLIFPLFGLLIIFFACVLI